MTTTKEKQIDFMWHLHGQGFSLKEIANLYNVSEKRMEGVLERKFKNKKNNLDDLHTRNRKEARPMGAKRIL